MSQFLSILLFSLSVVAYSLKESLAHGKFRWAGKPWGFWGEDSDLRKYSKVNGTEDAPNNWYYRLTGVKYRERFPLSATLFVMFTDGMHASQFVFKVLLCLSIAFYSPLFNLVVDSALYFVIWGIVFSITYKALSSQT